MPNLTEYTHIECDVTAAQFTSATQGEIAAEIMKHVTSGEIETYNLAKDSTTGAYTLTFKYKGDISAQVVNIGDYVVVLNTGHFVGVKEHEFEALYLHSELDPVIAPEDIKTIPQVVSNLAYKKYPELGIRTPEDLTEANLLKLAEAMADEVYSTEHDEIKFDFSNCGLVNFHGLAQVVNAFMRASYVNMKTTVLYKFENSYPALEDVNRLVNRFNIIGLTDSIAEFKQVDKAIRLRGTLITFGTRSTEVENSVLPSVTKEQFTQFKSELGEQFAANFTVNLEG